MNEEKFCDHASVGVLIVNRRKKLLLIERMKYPFGFAPPAGHLDGDSFEGSVVRETKEEVGLDVGRYTKILDRQFDNACSRRGGYWHHWHVYRADEWSGKVRRSKNETKKAVWVSKSGLLALAERTEAYIKGKISGEEWQKNPGIEIVWHEIFKILNAI